MRSILIINPPGGLSNLGDTAMLQVAVERFREYFPDATIANVTAWPERLASCCPGVKDQSEQGRVLWCTAALPEDSKLRILPSAVRRGWHGLVDRARVGCPDLMQKILRFKFRGCPRRRAALDAFMEAMREADLVVVGGGGAITDEFKDYAIRELQTLALAQRLGKPTVMFGQGMGPVDDPELRAWALRVLPRVSQIALREGRRGPALLREWGVADERVCVTGDDVIEMVHQERRTELGNGIGVNLRLARYSQVSDEHLQTIRRRLHGMAQSCGAPLVPAPIAFDEEDSDPRAIRALLAGFDDSTDGGEGLREPRDTISQIARCRIMVTGSYHGGVFALSQGVPAVAIARSPYYRDKFEGLADQFGEGCLVLLVTAEDFESEFHSALRSLWEQAEALRPALLEAARRQIEAGRAAYERLLEL